MASLAQLLVASLFRSLQLTLNYILVHTRANCSRKVDAQLEPPPPATLVQNSSHNTTYIKQYACVHIKHKFALTRVPKSGVLCNLPRFPNSLSWTIESLTLSRAVITETPLMSLGVVANAALICVTPSPFVCFHISLRAFCLLFPHISAASRSPCAPEVPRVAPSINFISTQIALVWTQRCFCRAIIIMQLFVQDARLVLLLVTQVLLLRGKHLEIAQLRLSTSSSTFAIIHFLHRVLAFDRRFVLLTFTFLCLSRFDTARRFVIFERPLRFPGQLQSAALTIKKCKPIKF